MTEVTRYDGPFESTWLQGHVDTSYAHLVEVFGEPEEGDDYKTDAEWTLMTPAGIATVYNYKDGKNYNGSAGTPTEKITDWHIGGQVSEVVNYVKEALREENGS